jgi:hypothetical protein
VPLLIDKEFLGVPAARILAMPDEILLRVGSAAGLNAFDVLAACELGDVGFSPGSSLPEAPSMLCHRTYTDPAELSLRRIGPSASAETVAPMRIASAGTSGRADEEPGLEILRRRAAVGRGDAYDCADRKSGDEIIVTGPAENDEREASQKQSGDGHS